jgi:hypothetical protein
MAIIPHAKSTQSRYPRPTAASSRSALCRASPTKGGYSCSSVETELVVQVLGDAPRDTSLAIWIGADLKGAWQLA